MFESKFSKCYRIQFPLDTVKTRFFVLLALTHQLYWTRLSDSGKSNTQSLSNTFPKNKKNTFYEPTSGY